MAKRIRKITLIGLVATPLIGIILFVALIVGVPVLSGWGYFLTPTFVLGVVPLALVRLGLIKSGLNKVSWVGQVAYLLAAWLVTFFVLFQAIPIIGETNYWQALRQAFVATGAVALLHAALSVAYYAVQTAARDVQPRP